MEDVTGAWLGRIEILPFDIDPEIEQEKGQCRQEQAIASAGGGGAGPQRVQEAVARVVGISERKCTLRG